MSAYFRIEGVITGNQIKIYILNVIAENFLSFGQEKKSPSFDQNSHLCREIASTLLHEINAVY